MGFQLTLLFIIIFSGCQNKNSVSYENLTNAFVDWYYKYNPIVSTFHGDYSNNNKQHEFTKKKYKERIEDLNHFKIEISQIDETKLTYSQKIQIVRLDNLLEYLSYDAESYLNNNPDITYQLFTLYEGIYYLFFYEDIEMSDRVLNLINRLEISLDQINNLTNNIVCINKDQVDVFNIVKECFLHLLNDLPIKIYAENLVLDEIDSLINQIVIGLNNLNEKIDQRIISNCNGMRSVHIVNYLTKINNIDSINIKINNSSLILKNEIFSMSLQEFLKDNDEPIWVDYDDSLHVIKEVYNKIFNDTISNGTILSEIYSSTKLISDIINTNHGSLSSSPIKNLEINYGNVILNIYNLISFSNTRASSGDYIMHVNDNISHRIAESSLKLIKNKNYIDGYLYAHLRKELIMNEIKMNNTFDRIYFDLFELPYSVHYYKDYYDRIKSNANNNFYKLLIKIEYLVNMYQAKAIINDYSIDQTIDLFMSDKILSSFINIDGVLQEINSDYMNILLELFVYNKMIGDKESVLYNYLKNS